MDRGLADLMRGGVEFDVDDAEGTVGDDGAGRVGLGKDPEAVTQAAGADLVDAEANFQHLFEARGFAVVAGNFQAWPAILQPAVGLVDAEPEGTEEGVLGGFDEAEEIREVHDAGEVGVGELDRAAVAEMKMSGSVHATGEVSPRRG